MAQYIGPERQKNDAPSFSKFELLTGATDTWTAEDSNTTFALSRATGIDITLPTITADNVGARLRARIVTTTTDAYTFTAAATQLLLGTIEMVDTDTSNATITYAPDGSDDLIVTLNGTTTGGLVSSWVEFEAIYRTSTLFGWWVNGISRHSGDVATPFS